MLHFLKRSNIIEISTFYCTVGIHKKGVRFRWNSKLSTNTFLNDNVLVRHIVPADTTQNVDDAQVRSVEIHFFLHFKTVVAPFNGLSGVVFQCSFIYRSLKGANFGFVVITSLDK